LDLLERDAPLARLTEIFDGVRRGTRGACVLVHGEAGIGKTSLVQSFIGTLEPAAASALVTGCEHLYTPRPLGPLVDLADRFPPSVMAALHEGSTWNGLFPKLLGHLRESKPCTVLVIEDMHWADAATLDFVRYLGRRLHDVRTLLLLSYRSDELELDHPLRRVIGELPGGTTTRLAIERLSPAAVATLATRSGRSPCGLFEATHGNPFYLTELLAEAGGHGVPPSVTDAVLARLAQLPASARALAELVSVSPAQTDLVLLKSIEPDCDDAIDRCVRRGLLVTHDEVVAFRHELAREAVLQALDPLRRKALHAAVLSALPDGSDGELARQVHHAEGAGLVDAVASLAPRAARHASASGAHREAARLYALALRYRTNLSLTERGDMLEAYALECTMTGRYGDAIRARQEALAVYREIGDRRREGIGLCWLARLHGWSDSVEKAFEHAHESIAALETLAPDGELAIAYGTLSHLYLVSDRLGEVQAWGAKAIDLAERVGHAAALSQALNTVACARLRFADDGPAWHMLERSLQLALDEGLPPEAALAFSNLQMMSLVNRHYARAMTWAERGIAYCEARGMDVFTVRMRIRRAFGSLQTGRWDLADTDLAEIRQYHIASPMERATCAFVHGLLDLRRGLDGAAERVGETCATMQRLRVRIWFTSVPAACAEAAWLLGDADAVEAAVLPTLAPALALEDRWRAGECAAWLVRAGRAPSVPHGRLSVPHALEVQGRQREAADCWRELGCPYESALALAGSDDEGLLRDALQRFEQLGATPAADAVRRRLRGCGARGLFRGPQPRTRGDPLGLTAREREVFEHLLRGASNAAIAQCLHRSGRTVEHHVAAVFDKLGVNTRAQLIAGFANQLGTRERRFG
jgi:DNA-binding CsgD family transcriptional regulator/tetratricopeptide (TPR) repeat protein